MTFSPRSKVEQTIRTFAEGQAWYIRGLASDEPGKGQYPVNAVVFDPAVRTESGVQFVNGTLYTASEVGWEKFVEVAS